MSVARPGLSDAALTALIRDDRRIVITGASGWLGSATIELLHDALGEDIVGRLHCFGSGTRTLTFRDGLTIEQRPLGDIARLDRRPSIVLHFAFLTKDRVSGMTADDYITANAALGRIVLDALDPIGAEGVFVASSGAAHFASDPAADPAMRLYGTLKQRDEIDFADWAETRGQTAVIARVFNVAGPYINKHQAYALAAFIIDALAGRPITVRAPHQVVRGFVAIRELMSLVFALLGGPSGVHRFDTAGDAMELGEVARAVANVLGPVPVDRATITSDRLDRYVGDGDGYDRLRARFAIDTVSLADQIRETADYLVDTAMRIDGEHSA